ncbi:MAG: hypothetical protein A2Y40_06525 [Candidatus Margulisbacteria bacterium GWF2_35_9]|nr:MAG: hypothetical protein A2Y40_06525 [Candidatus Margulisbacteria bacterium GWF2_35_9]
MLANNKTKILSNGKMLLRPFNMNDVGDMYCNWSNEMGHVFFPKYSLHMNWEITFERIRNIIDSYLSEDTYIWAIEYSNGVIGYIEVVNIYNNDSSCCIYYYLCSKVNDKIFINEAISLVDNYLQNSIGINNIKYKDILNT